MGKDNFSQQAILYATYRPSYPSGLIDYILQFLKHKQRAWDCATGNGQAAILLADHFEQVMATDQSEKQLMLAIPKKNITYSIAKAEQTSFPDNYFDLITVAQAYHWLPPEAFHKEVVRVARPGGIIAVWGYNIPIAEFPALNETIKYFYTDIVGKYWDPERKWIDQEYQSIPFPFEELPSSRFEFPVEWQVMQLAGYLHSWSSVHHFQEANNYDPVEDFLPQLLIAWPDPGEKIMFRFPIFLRIGKVKD